MGSPLLFSRAVENVVKEPDDTSVPEYIQTVENAGYFKTMSMYQEARMTRITVQ
jgi:hypothetical protein